MTIQSLRDLYLEELRDLYSGNAQMRNVVSDLKSAASNASLQEMLGRTITKIEQHNQTLKDLLESQGASGEEEYCKGMEGLVKEARSHALEEQFEDEAVRDAAIISQVQRMSHYGLAGYGTARALAHALGLEKEAATLNDTLANIYEGDSYLSHLAERQVNEEAA